MRNPTEQLGQCPQQLIECKDMSFWLPHTHVGTSVMAQDDLQDTQYSWKSFATATGLAACAEIRPHLLQTFEQPGILLQSISRSSCERKCFR